MCDEYDDERMVAFWRRLELQEQIKREERELQEIELPLTTAIPEARKTRPRALIH